VGIAGLSEGVAWLLERGSALFEHDRRLRMAMLDGLRDLDAWGPRAGARGLRLLGPTDTDARVGVFSLVHADLSPHELAGLLEQGYGILARAGLHCAPRAHGAIGTRDQGALRLSPGPFHTTDDVARVIHALAEIGAAASSPARA